MCRRGVPPTPGIPLSVSAPSLDPRARVRVHKTLEDSDHPTHLREIVLLYMQSILDYGHRTARPRGQ